MRKLKICCLATHRPESLADELFLIVYPVLRGLLKNQP